MFSRIKGQPGALQLLKTALQHDRISQAYLFHGVKGVGKFSTALYFGMALNCLAMDEFRPCGKCTSCKKFMAFTHPDLLYVFPTPNLQMTAEGEIKSAEGLKQYEAWISNKIHTPWQEYFFASSSEIRKESINMLIRRLDMSIFEGRYRICIIEDADEMNLATANAFLKTLEEPPASTVIILTTSRMSMLPATILSRCQAISFHPVGPTLIEGILRENFDVPEHQARIAARIADGSVERAIYLSLNESSAIRDQAFEIFLLGSNSQELQFLNLLQRPGIKLTADLVTELLRHVSLFCADLNLMLNSPGLIVNVDKRDVLDGILENMQPQAIKALSDTAYEFILKVEDLNRRVVGNVNLQLIMLSMFNTLSKVFRGEG